MLALLPGDPVVPDLLQQTRAAVLVEVDNPFGRALQEGIDLNAEFEKGPEEGDAAFGEYVTETRQALARALESGADGVLYRVFGAEPTLAIGSNDFTTSYGSLRTAAFMT